MKPELFTKIVQQNLSRFFQKTLVFFCINISSNNASPGKETFEKQEIVEEDNASTFFPQFPLKTSNPCEL